MTGLHLAQYRIDEELGRGGMGIVYLATDTKLNRQVAIKVLPAAALASEDDRARFFREAQAAAQLSHPNVCHVYQVDEAVPTDADGAPVAGQDGKRPFIAMEFIDGETLHARIAKGPLKLTEAVNIAAQVADALKAAHAKNIVHRDIKSANVMLTPEGVAKVLDFGLAKTNQSTMLTRMGSTLGTVAYMSPEQARGQEVDGRSDLYSLGTVLYEMIAGRLPFTADYEQAVVYGILNEPPEPLTSLRTGVPVQLEWLVSKLLSKEAEYRYQTAADLLADLKSADLTGSGHSRRSMAALPAATTIAPPPVAASSRFGRAAWLALALLPIGVGIGWLAFAGGGDTAGPASPRQFFLEIPDFTSVNSIAVSHDGNTLFVTPGGSEPARLAAVDLRTGEARTIVPDVRPGRVAVSRDNQWLAYEWVGSLYRVAVTGGAPIVLARNAFGRPLWLPDGSLLAGLTDSTGASIYRFPASGDAPDLVRRYDRAAGVRALTAPLFLGDPHRVAVTVVDSSGASIGLIDVDSGDLSILGPGFPLLYAPSGHLLYVEGLANQGRVLVRPFDREEGIFTGPPVTLEENADTRRLAIDGLGTYFDGSGGGPATESFLAQIIRDGEVVESWPLGVTANGLQPRVSPDGARALFRVNSMGQGTEQIREIDLRTGLIRPFTVESDGDADNLAFSPDGSEVVIESNDKLYRRNTNRSGRPVELSAPDGTGVMDWSPSGRWIAHTDRNTSNFSRLQLLDLDTGTSTTLDPGPGVHGFPRFSPDERFISYYTMEGGTRSVWVMSLEDGNRFKVSEAEGGTMSAWTSDGRYLYFSSTAGIHRVPVTLDPYFETTGPVEQVLGEHVREFDLVGGSHTILAISSATPDQSASAARIRVVTDWVKDLPRIAPAAKQ